MRIGVNAVFLGEGPSGVAVFTRQLIRSLSHETRHQVVVYSSVPLDGVEERLRVRTPAPARGSARFFGNLLRFAYINVILPGRFRSPAIDVLYCPITEYPHRSSVPLVVHVHDVHPLDFPDQFGLAAPRFRWELSRLHAVRGRITVSSRYVRDRLLEGGYVDEHRLDVVPLGYDSTLFSPAGQNERHGIAELGIDRPYILCMGSGLSYKNLQGAVTAFGLIARDVPHLLVLAGESGSVARETGGDRVRRCGPVSGRTLRNLYSFADLVVYPSLSEGFGLVPLEAMASGAPVIAFNRTAIPEVVGDAAFLVEETSPEALAEGIRRVLGDPAMREDLRVRGRQRAKEFSWERTAAGIVSACSRAAEHS